LRRFPGIHLLYRDLIALRRNRHGTTRGLQGQHVHAHHVNHDAKVLAFHRWLDGGPGDDVVVILNFANRGYPAYELGFPRAGRWRVRFNSDWEGYDPDFNNWPSLDVGAWAGPMHNLPARGVAALGPYPGVILSQAG
ncbi:MAG TPA: alpha amylase C-terminal domain-containing protein, partial [Verrucomicrobiota bacterium]|nr:alpha amylase C-terminal domain-containing protein [Verrucomicrobiota bacterium]